MTRRVPPSAPGRQARGAPGRPDRSATPETAEVLFGVHPVLEALEASGLAYDRPAERALRAQLGGLVEPDAGREQERVVGGDAAPLHRGSASISAHTA